MRVRSGPSPARDTAATTFTFAGNARHASRAVPSKTSVGVVMASRSSPATPGAPASPRGGFRVSMVTLARWPSTAAPFSPSSPAIAAEGAWIRAPRAAACSTHSGWSRSAPTERTTRSRPASEDRRGDLDEGGLGGGLHDQVDALEEIAERE